MPKRIHPRGYQIHQLRDVACPATPAPLLFAHLNTSPAIASLPASSSHSTALRYISWAACPPEDKSGKHMVAAGDGQMRADSLESYSTRSRGCKASAVRHSAVGAAMSQLRACSNASRKNLIGTCPHIQSTRPPTAFPPLAGAPPALARHGRWPLLQLKDAPPPHIALQPACSAPPHPPTAPCLAPPPPPSPVPWLRATRSSAARAPWPCARSIPWHEPGLHLAAGRAVTGKVGRAEPG